MFSLLKHSYKILYIDDPSICLVSCSINLLRAINSQYKAMERKNIVLAIVVLGTMMAAIDSTIVLLAFPTIVSGLNSNFLTIIWVILAYLLVVTVFMTQFGRIGDIYGRARTFNFGFLIFAVSSFFCGLANTDVFLIGSRIAQAIGGAMMSANSGAIIADTFEPDKRGRAFGFTTLGWNIGAMLGIVLGGIITTFLGWRYIFFINVPIGAVAFIMGLKYVKDVVKIKADLDIRGMLLFGAAIALISYSAITSVASAFSLINAAMMVMGVFIMGAFIFFELRTEKPLLDLRQFSNKILRSGIFASFFQSLGYFAVVFLIIMYLQGIRGLSPLDASLLLIPGYIVSSSLSPLMGKFSDRIGSREIATTGIILMGIAILAYLMLTPNTSYYVFIIITASIVSGMGSAMFFPANTSAVMANAKTGAYGATNGLLRTMSSLGIMFSFVLSISIAAYALPSSAAFQVFVGTSTIAGGISTTFMSGVYAALYVSLVVLVIAGIFSATRGKESRGQAIFTEQNMRN